MRYPTLEDAKAAKETAETPGSDYLKAKEAWLKEKATSNGKHAESGAASDGAARRVLLTPASQIKVRRVWWLWEHRLAVGTLALLAGREGLGKSILAYTIGAMITRGELPGEHLGTSRAVLVAATEDSWSQTIVPRLIAAGADLTRVFKTEVLDADVHRQLDLPVDLARVQDAVEQTGAVLLILDPLLSRLSDKLDTHKDAEVRTALEPMVAMAERMDFSVLGLIHHNKSGSSDPLQLVMASKAFTAVARSVHTVMTDPNDETERRRLYGTPKNNLGRDDLPVLSFTISPYEIPTDEGPTETGRLHWGKDAEISIFEAMRRSTEDRDKQDAGKDAAEWLEGHLRPKGGRAESQEVKRAAREAKISDWALRRGRDLLKIQIERDHDFKDPKTWWSLRVGHVGVGPGETLTTNTNNMKGSGEHGRVGCVGQEDSPGEPTQAQTDGCAVPTWRVCSDRECHAFGGCLARKEAESRK